MLRVCVFLHFYLPPFQRKITIETVVKDIYGPILMILERSPAAKINLAVSAAHLREAVNCGHNKLARSILKLAKRGQVEFVETAYAGAALPLLPDEVVESQIWLNQKYAHHCFGLTYKPTGFVAPQISYSPKLARLIFKLGYQWMLVDELSLAPELNCLSYDLCYQDARVGSLMLFPTQRKISHAALYSPDIKRPSDFFLDPYQFWYLETSALSSLPKKRFDFVLKLISSSKSRISHISELTKEFGSTVQLSRTRPSCEVVYPDELTGGIAFPTFKHPNNSLHKIQWELMEALLNLAKSNNQRMRKISRLLFFDQLSMTSMSRTWGIANRLSFLAARKQAELIKQWESKKQGQQARKLYEDLIVKSYELEKQDWFDKKVPKADQKWLEYRQGLAPLLKQELGDEMAREKERKSREKSN